MNKTQKIETPITKTSRRVRSLLKRALREKNRGAKSYEKSRNAITLALQCGLQPEQPVEIEVIGEDGSKVKELFAVKNNFAGEVAFKNAYVSKYELTKVPKFKRVPKEEAPAAAEAAL